MDEPLMEDTVLPYFVGIDCVIEKGEYGSSDSLAGWAFAANRVLGNEFVYPCCCKSQKKKKKGGKTHSFLKYNKKNKSKTRLNKE